ncbi:MAG: hypothetical protein QM785_17020 [Pyrinomonadaceae bacterium]
MYRLLIFFCLFLGIAISAIGQSSVPKFTQFPVAVEKAKSVKTKGRPIPLKYIGGLKEAAKRGVNFAGHFVLAGRGCGTGCTNAYIINARTGEMLYPDQLFNIDATYGDGYSDIQLDFKKNSRLLIIHGRPGSKNENANIKPGDYYYEWKNNRLRLLKFVEKKND